MIIVIFLIIIISIVPSNLLPIQNLDLYRYGMKQVNADYYMRVDDMIFLMKKTRAGLKGDIYRWPDGVIPYTVQEGLPKEMLRMLRKTMAILEDKTCIEFVYRTDEEDYINITHTESGCFAHVGHMNRGAQKLNLGKGCWSFGTVVHELIHSIGFSHEHQRNDRDKYVTIRYENMKPGKEHNFKLDKEMGLRFSYFGVPYNYASVMHYSKSAFSMNGAPTIIPKKLSEIDEDYDEILYNEIDNEGRPVIGQKELTRGDVVMINRMYEDYCE